MEYVGIIPQMTSNNTPSPFVASASSQLATYVPAYAFQSGMSAWITDVANSYLQIDLGKPHRVEKVYFDSKTDWTYARVVTFQLLASNDLITWDKLEDRATTATYDFTGVKKYGTYRYWRLVCKNMTGRGGVVREFQLYRSKFNGKYEFDEPDTFIVEGNTSSLIGSVEPDVKATVTIKLNNNIIYEKKDVVGLLDIDIPYSADDFNVGANLISIELVDDLGSIVEFEHVVFKLTKVAAVPKLTSYQFAIKNSPRYPQTDGWIGQIYNFDYLNSETGISYMFRYKPFAQLEARIEDKKTYAEKVDTKNAIGVFGNILSERSINGSSGIVLDLKKASISTIRKAVKYDGYSIGFKEAGLVNQILQAWSIIDKDDVGIVSNAILAMKRDKATHNTLSTLRNIGHRNKELLNTLNVMNAHVTAQRRVGNAIVNYYELFKEVHPYKDSVIALEYITSIGLDKIVYYNNLEPMVTKMLKDMMTLESDVFVGKGEDMGVKGEYVNAQFLIPQKESISLYETIAHKIDRHGHNYPYATLGTQFDNIGVKQEYLNASGLDKQGIKNELLNVDKYLENRVVYLSSLFNMDKDVKVKEGIMSNMLFIDDTTEIDAYITHSLTRVSLMSQDAMIERVMSNVLLNNLEATTYQDGIKKTSKMPDLSYNMQNNISYMDVVPMDVNNLFAEIRFVEKVEKNALGHADDLIKFDSIPANSLFMNDLYGFNKVFKNSDDITDNYTFFDSVGKNVRFVMDFVYIDKNIYGKEGLEVNDGYSYVENIAKAMSVITYDTYTDPSMLDAFDFSETVEYVDKTSKGIMLRELDVVVDKLKVEVFKVELLTVFNVLEKVSLILDNWKFFVRTSSKGKSLEDASVQFIKEELQGTEMTDKVALRKFKDTYLTDQLVVDYENLDAYITQLAGNFERANEHDAGELFNILSNKTDSLAFVQDSITSNRENVEKEAIIKDDVILVDDESEWQDIWNRYSPGVDVLDPPDDDYDYSKLVPVVYDEVTGKPLHPIGATNKADIVVGVPLAHPIPENNEVGIDETKRIAVDNYIFIDSVLAIESIKNRNKLRYAGMPAGKTIREVFSQLYTWIQQAAPGHEEYERMFRFARWYAESVTIKQSKFILERTYNPWLSSLHKGGGLGTPHMKAGWVYNTVTNTYDTTSAAAHLEFTKELMIDGEFILRGYFDNPLSHGTIEISVDGVIVETFSSNGVFEKTVEVPQGNHVFRIDFMGVDSAVSISTIEITGVQFVSAITVTDDSDTNGLKALNELMSQLLGYFELHHGGNKVKGTMEIRQRAVWNTHT